MVGRPREFDVDEALEAAMRAFWAKGYESTSFADLEEATGVHKQSLCKAFGCKHELFVKALKRYLNNMHINAHDLLASAASPLQGLQSVTHGMIDIFDADAETPMGCLAVNSLVELAPHDPEVAKIMNEDLQHMLGTIATAVGSAQEAGEIRDDRPAETIALLMMTFMTGLGSLVKGGITKEHAHRLVDAQMESLF